MFSRKTIHDEYAKVVKEIDGGARREPQHDRPATLGGKYGPTVATRSTTLPSMTWFFLGQRSTGVPRTHGASKRPATRCGVPGIWTRRIMGGVS